MAGSRKCFILTQSFLNGLEPDYESAGDLLRIDFAESGTFLNCNPHPVPGGRKPENLA
jgi:hypothetical protein